MRSTIEKIKSGLTYSGTRTGGCFSAPNELVQLQWRCCLICGDFIYKMKSCSNNIICKDIKHFRYNYDEDLKQEIQNIINLIERCDKAGHHDLIKKNKKMLAVLSIKLADENIMTLDEHNSLLRRFGLYDEVLS